jgi:hypothetical protein
MSKKFRAVTETVVDARKRISLGKAGVAEDARYLVSVNDDGEILLAPLASVPARELLIWEDRPLRESLIRGMEQAAAGDLHDLGTFERFLDADEA